MEIRHKAAGLASRLSCLALAAALAAGMPGAALARDDKPVAQEPELGAYLIGRLAEADNMPTVAASAYRRALESDPASAEIARRSYRQAILAGDMALALRCVQSLRQQEMLPSDAMLLLAINGLSRKDYAAALRTADLMVGADQLSFMVPYVRSWASVGRGPYDPPVLAMAEPFAAYAMRHLDEQLMWQRLAMGDGAGAREALAAVRAKGLGLSTQMREELALRFAAAGQVPAALSLLPFGAPDAYAAVRNRIEGGAKLALPPIQPAAGIAILLDRLASDLASGGNALTVLNLLRLAQFADPTNSAITLDVSRALLGAGYPALAYEEAGKLNVTASSWFDAQVIRVAALLRQQRNDDALAYANRLNQRPGAGASEQRLLVDTMLQVGQEAQATELLGALVTRPENAADARLRLQYGAALLSANRWGEAKVQLEKALELEPANPSILNYLGYSLVERREELPRALAMLEKVVKLAPEEAAYIDSLGWAYYQTGQAAKALPLLETAVEKAPGQPDINEHLGDVLWSLGRRFEARHAWSAAAIFANDTEKERLAGKKLVGLEAGKSQ